MLSSEKKCALLFEVLKIEKKNNNNTVYCTYKCITYYLKIVPSDLCQCQATNVHNKYIHSAHTSIIFYSFFITLLILFGCVLVKLFLILRFYYMRHCVTYYTIFLCQSNTYERCPTRTIREKKYVRQSAVCSVDDQSGFYPCSSPFEILLVVWHLYVRARCVLIGGGKRVPTHYLLKKNEMQF